MKSSICKWPHEYFKNRLDKSSLCAEAPLKLTTNDLWIPLFFCRRHVT